MNETEFYEPARLSVPPKPLFSLKPLEANLVEVIVIFSSHGENTPVNYLKANAGVCSVQRK